VTDVSQRPLPGEARHYAFPRFVKSQLPNGLRVVVATVTKLPIVTIQAVIDAGAACDPTGKEGLASIVARLLTEGAGALDGAAFVERTELLGTSLSTAADWDSAVVSMSVLSQRFGQALATMTDVLTDPMLPDRELQRLKGERLAELLQLQAEPRTLADEMFSRVLYAPASRYSRPHGGSEASVESITSEDVRKFHGGRYTPSETTIIVVGDITPAEAMSQIERSLGNWSGAAQPREVVKAVRASGAARVHLVQKDGAPQSELRVGFVGLPRATEDYLDVVVMNAILGGLFSSRINLSLREKHGYTYGASSAFEFRRDAGPFQVATAVRSDVTVESIREIISEISRMRTSVVGDDELSLALKYLGGVFPIRFETTAAIGSALSSMVVHNLPDDFFDCYRDQLALVTGERVLQAAQKHLKEHETEIVVVGDPGTVRAALEEYAAGSLALHSADEASK
jgi:predicted Zn-dependent peptidase